MKISRKFIREPSPVHVAPMLNVLFLILLMFIATTIYGQMEKVFGIQLPALEAIPEQQREQGEIYVNLAADGSIDVNNRKLNEAGLQEVLNRVAEYFPGGAVIIRGDSRVALGPALAVLSACRKAGIENVSFAASATPPDVGAAPQAAPESR